MGVDFRQWADEQWPGLYEWMMHGDCGVSSKWLVFWVCGIPSASGFGYPLDESDYQRCLGLAREVPAILAGRRLELLAQLHPEWWPWVERLRREAKP